MARPIGRKMSDDDRNGKPLSAIINGIAQFIRTDFGGAPDENTKIERMTKKVDAFLAEEGHNISPEGKRIIAKFAIKFAVEQCEGSRKRIASNIDELRRRANQTAKARDLLPEGSPRNLLNAVIDGQTAKKSDELF